MTDKTQAEEGEVRRLLDRVAEQQSVETAYAMEEASTEEMFTATAATYAAAARLRAFPPERS